MDLEALFYLIVGFCAGIVGFLVGLSLMKRRRLIQNIPTSKIRSLAMGLCEIFGEAVPAEKKILKSPFSQKDCVYYKYKVEELKSSGKSSKWVKIAGGESSVPFFLKDSTGMVLVDSKRASVDISRDNLFESRAGKDPSEIIKKFLKKENLEFEGRLFGINKNMRYTEWFIAPGDKLYILGTAGDNPYVDEASAASNQEDIMIQKGNEIYLISDKSEKEVLSKLNEWSMLGIIGGPLLSLVCLLIILISLFGGI